METTTIYPYYNTPAIGKRITLNNEPVIVTAHGDACRITDDDPSLYGSHLLGFEGSKGRQVTVRSATTEELADLNAASELKAAAIAAQNDLRTIAYRVLGAQNAAYLLGNGGFARSAADYADDDLNAAIRAYQAALTAYQAAR